MSIERSRLEHRLGELRNEFERGQELLSDLEREVSELRDGLLRIAGAIRELEDLLSDRDDANE